jgi:drug/metabolite transporter (DMT)-like permease
MAAGYLLSGRVARQSLDLCAYSFGVYSTAAVALLLCCLLTGTPLLGFSRETYLALVLLAIIPQLIGHTTFNWTLKFLTPATVAVLILGEPIGATILAYIILGETLSLLKAVGLVVLGVGILLSSLAVPAGPRDRLSPPDRSSPSDHPPPAVPEH